MIPFPLSMTPTDRPIDKCNPAARDQDPAEGLTISKVGCRVDGQTHEYVPRAVNGHQAVHHLPVGGEGGRLEFEKFERVVRADHGIYAESDEDGSEDAGGDAEGGGLGEGGGSHVWIFTCDYELRVRLELFGSAVCQFHPDTFCFGGERKGCDVSASSVVSV